MCPGVSFRPQSFEDDFQTFTSLEDVVTRIKGLATPSLEKIIEKWS